MLSFMYCFWQNTPTINQKLCIIIVPLDIFQNSPKLHSSPPALQMRFENLL